MIDGPASIEIGSVGCTHFDVRPGPITSYRHNSHDLCTKLSKGTITFIFIQPVSCFHFLSNSTIRRDILWMTSVGQNLMEVFWIHLIQAPIHLVLTCLMKALLISHQTKLPWRDVVFLVFPLSQPCSDEWIKSLKEKWDLFGVRFLPQVYETNCRLANAYSYEIRFSFKIIWKSERIHSLN